MSTNTTISTSLGTTMSVGTTTTTTTTSSTTAPKEAKKPQLIWDKAGIGATPPSSAPISIAPKKVSPRSNGKERDKDSPPENSPSTPPKLISMNIPESREGQRSPRKAPSVGQENTQSKSVPKATVRSKYRFVEKIQKEAYAKFLNRLIPNLSKREYQKRMQDVKVDLLFEGTPESYICKCLLFNFRETFEDLHLNYSSAVKSESLSMMDPFYDAIESGFYTGLVPVDVDNSEKISNMEFNHQELNALLTSDLKTIDAGIVQLGDYLEEIDYRFDGVILDYENVLIDFITEQSDLWQVREFLEENIEKLKHIENDLKSTLINLRKNINFCLDIVENNHRIEKGELSGIKFCSFDGEFSHTNSSSYNPSVVAESKVLQLEINANLVMHSFYQNWLEINDLNSDYCASLVKRVVQCRLTLEDNLQVLSELSAG